MISGRVMAVFPASGITTVAKRPEEMRDTFVVALQHDGAPMMEDDRRIVLKFGVPYNLQTLTRPFIAEREGGRFEDLTVLGANIRFTGIAGDSLTYEVLNPMPLQPFAVSMRTETRTFYMPY